MPVRSDLIDRRWLPLILLGLCACAKTGEPQPPQLLVPRPALDLGARQLGDGVLLTVSPPVLNTNGSAATTLGRVEFFRLTETVRSDRGPFGEELFLAQARRIRSLPADELAAHLRGDLLSLVDQPEAADPAAFFTRGFRYAVRFVNRRNQTAGLSNQAFIAPVPIPAAPEGLACALRPESILLTWQVPASNQDGSAPARIAGFNVYRLDDPKAVPIRPLNDEPLQVPEFADRAFEFDRTYYYAVSVVGSRQDPAAESTPSPLLQVTPKDTFPPAAPGELTAVAENGAVTLLWRPSLDADLAGYRIYRQAEGSADRTLMQEQLVTTLSFRDDRATPGTRYQYQVVAVDTHGNESPATAITVEAK